MVGKSAKSDRKGRSLLVVSTLILLLAFTGSVIFLRSEFRTPSLIVWAFLQPAAQNGIGMVYSDKIRSSPALTTLSFSLALSAIFLAAVARVSTEVLVLIPTVYIVWGGLFQIALGMTRGMQLNLFYGVMAMWFWGTFQREKGGGWPWLSLSLIPLSLTLAMSFLSRSKFYADIDEAGDWDTAEDPLLAK